MKKAEPSKAETPKAETPKAGTPKAAPSYEDGGKDPEKVPSPLASCRNNACLNLLPLGTPEYLAAHARAAAAAQLADAKEDKAERPALTVNPSSLSNSDNGVDFLDGVENKAEALVLPRRNGGFSDLSRLFGSTAGPSVSPRQQGNYRSLTERTIDVLGLKADDVEVSLKAADPVTPTAGKR